MKITEAQYNNYLKEISRIFWGSDYDGVYEVSKFLREIIGKSSNFKPSLDRAVKRIKPRGICTKGTDVSYLKKIFEDCFCVSIENKPFSLIKETFYILKK